MHHYKSAGYAFETLDIYRTRDSVKQQLATDRGISLITIPFWWDGKIERSVLFIHSSLSSSVSHILILTCSVMATIKKHRPDLLTDANPTAAPIPEQMPISLMDQYKTQEIEDIGEPITACFLTGTDKDPTNWYVLYFI